MKTACGRHGLVPGVRKIAILNPSAIGDFVVTLPAIHALKAAYRAAHMVYLGKQWHAELLRGRPGPIDSVTVLPPVAGVGAPPDCAADASAVEDFVQAMQAHRFDLAFQMYGGGRYSNPFIKRLGARMTVGLKAQDAQALDRYIPYIYLQNNRLRMLEVAGLAGAGRVQTGQELAVAEHDRTAADEALSVPSEKRLIVIHPGASDLRRRWPADRFAAMADALAADGACIVISGVDSEREMVRQIASQMHHPAVDMCGRLPLPALCGLLERAALVIANDTGPLHLALAIGTPCVGIYWFSNLMVAAPLVHQWHRAALSLQIHCPICGAENVYTRCPHDVSFVESVTVDEVLQLSRELLDTGCPVSER